MTLYVYTEGRSLYIRSDERKTVLKHRIPKRNKYFKEEIRRYKAEIQTWLCGAQVDEIHFETSEKMPFHQIALYNTIIRATRRTDGLVLLISEEEVT